MKSLFIFFTLLSFTVMAASASLSSSTTPEVTEESAGDEDTLKSVAIQFLGSLPQNSSISTEIDRLLVGSTGENALKAVSALQHLAEFDFTKKQLTCYGSLLAHTVPAILGSNFDLENGELGKHIGNVMEFFQSKNFAAASESITKAMSDLDTDSHQRELLNGIVFSYAPMLDPMDSNETMDTEKLVMKKKKTSRS